MVMNDNNRGQAVALWYALASPKMTRIVKKLAEPPARNKSRTAPQRKKSALPSSLDESLGYLLRRAQLSAFQEFSKFMDRFGLRPPQYAVLVLIGANQGLTQSAISAELGIQRANFVAMIDELQDQGLLERRRVAGDRRAFALHLTVAGEKLRHRAEKTHARYEAHLATRLGATQSTQLRTLLQKFVSISATSPPPSKHPTQSPPRPADRRRLG
jgi:DNA-binding MarR family transcriptional regulator